MSEYKKPKLKIRKISAPSVAKGEYSSPAKMSKAKGKAKMADVDVTLTPKKKKPGKITVIRKKSSVPKLDAKQMKGYRRVELEAQTKAEMKKAMKEAMEKKRLERAQKVNKMIKRIK